MKTINIIIISIVYLFALYGLIILIQKIRFDASTEDQRIKKGVGYRYWIEPFRRQWSNCRKETKEQCDAKKSNWIKWINGCCRQDMSF